MIQGRLRMTHLQDEYLDIFGEDKDFIDGEVED
jgi:hypothetical protein